MNISEEGAIVYAIDPSPDNCDFISKLSILNNITNVKIIQKAISNNSEILTTNNDLTHCSFVYENIGLNGKNRVQAVSLDYLYEMGSIDNIGYIHLDVEGMEYKILEGSIKIIEKFRPIISFEQHLEIDDYNIILSFFLIHKYKVMLINEILPGCRFDCRNSIAFPDEIYSDSLIENINSFIGENILIRK